MYYKRFHVSRAVVAVVVGAVVVVRRCLRLRHFRVLMSLRFRHDVFQAFVVVSSYNFGHEG